MSSKKVIHVFLKMGKNPTLDIEICGTATLGNGYSQ